MKLILVVLSLFTAQAHAESGTWYSALSPSCSSGEEFREDDQGEIATMSYLLSEDLSQLTVKTTTRGLSQTRHFMLTLMGKNAYMAVPLDGGSEEDYFYVSTGDMPAQIVISSADRSGESCNGGLILTTAKN